MRCPRLHPRSRALLLALHLLVGAATAQAATFLVTPDGTGDFPTIQAAISDPGVVAGDVIELGNGVFTGDGNRDLGYEGKAVTVRSQSGNPLSCTIDCQGTEMNPHRAVLFDTGEGPGSVLENVTITGGFITTALDGVIRSENTSPTIRGCRFTGNASSTLAMAVSCVGGSPALERCTFQGNSMAAAVLAQSVTALALRSCVIHDAGGALLSGGVIEITDCNVSAASGIGLSLDTVDDAVIRRTNVTGGTDTAILVRTCPSLLIDGCLVAGNASGRTAGIHLSGCTSPVLRNSTIVGNRASSGFFSASGLYLESNGGVTTVEGTTFTRNAVSGGFDGTVLVQDSDVSFLRSILWGDCGQSGQSELLVFSGAVSFTCCDVDMSEVATQGGSVVYVADNIDADPLFQSPESCTAAPTVLGFYELEPGSPCLPQNSPCGERIGASSDARRLYAISAATDQLYVINSETGATTTVGPLGINIGSGALDFENGQLLGLLTVAGQDAIYSIDPASGAATHVVDVDIAVSNRGVEFGPLGEPLYYTSGNRLYTFDIASGTSTLVGTIGSSASSLASGPGGRFYFITGAELFEVNRLTAEATTVGPLGTIASGTALAHHESSGKLYAISQSYDLLAIDPATGAASAVGPTGLTAQVVGLAFEWGPVVSVPGAGIVPPRLLALGRPSPNPFNPRVRVPFSLGQAVTIRLTVHDLAGRHVRTLAAGWREPGRHAVSWNGTDEAGRSVASGVYFLRLDAPGAQSVRRSVLAR